MKKKVLFGVLTAILSCVFVLGLSACDNNANINQFKVNDEVRSSLNLPWTMPIYNSPSSSFNDILDTDTVTITDYVLTASKEANLENTEDYIMGSTFYRYIYEAKIVGKVDEKFAYRNIWVGCHYPVSVGTKNKSNSSSNNVEINPDGSFVWEFYVCANEPINDFTPAQVTIGSYTTYRLTYTNTYDVEYKLPYKLPNSYTKKSNTITLPTLYNRTEYEEINGIYKEVTYEFDGWYNGETLVTQIPQGSYGDMELTAHWKRAD